jgi:predicted Zn finger-like uncharacterized protein
MDVQCERCKTDYLFDDALVSERGTMVRCTTCGHQFRVRAGADADTQPITDRWLVHTGAGQRLTFSSLRELQRAILTRQIVRSDVLLRGGGPWRDLGSIEELDPFFQASTSKRPHDGSGAPVPPMNTPGVAHFPDGASRRLTTPPSADVQSAPPERGRNIAEGPPSTFPKRAAQWSPDSSARPFVARVPAEAHGQFGTGADGLYPAPPEPGQDVVGRPKIETLRPPAGAAVAPPPPSTSSPPTGVPIQNATPPVTAGDRSVEFRPRYGGTGEVPYAETSAAGEMVMRPPQERTPAPFDAPVRAAPLLEPTPRPPSAMFQGDELPEMSSRAPSFSTEEDWYGAPPRRRVGGWVVAFVLMLAVGVVGWAVAKPYVLARKAASIHEPDPRAQQFAADGERALSEGNLESAQEAFDKASALAESSPRVLLDEARVEAAKADIPWLKLRLLSPDSAEEMRATKQQLDDRLTRVRKAAGDAVASAPADLSSARAAIDALRLEGATQEARSSVARIISQSSQPETAYVLAALDLAEPSPSWPTVIDRLRVAAAEGNGGRARAALVYALARSGDPTEARAELAKLESLPRPYPLLPHLRGFIDRSSARPVGSAGSIAINLASAGVREAAAQTRAGAQATPAGGGRVARNAEPARGGENPGGGMRAAARAIRAGDWDRARRIYEGLVERNPNDSEALSGIADVERAQGNVHGAIASYRQALSVNPSYLPALLGVADTEWGSGDRTNAQLTYKDIVERFPEGTYPSYVKIRAGAEGDRPASPSATVFSTVDAGASVDPDEP